MLLIDRHPRLACDLPESAVLDFATRPALHSRHAVDVAARALRAHAPVRVALARLIESSGALPVHGNPQQCAPAVAAFCDALCAEPQDAPAAVVSALFDQFWSVLVEDAMRPASDGSDATQSASAQCLASLLRAAGRTGAVAAGAVAGSCQALLRAVKSARSPAVHQLALADAAIDAGLQCADVAESGERRLRSSFHRSEISLAVQCMSAASELWRNDGDGADRALWQQILCDVVLRRAPALREWTAGGRARLCQAGSVTPWPTAAAWRGGARSGDAQGEASSQHNDLQSCSTPLWRTACRQSSAPPTVRGLGWR